MQGAEVKTGRMFSHEAGWLGDMLSKILKLTVVDDRLVEAWSRCGVGLVAVDIRC